MALSADLNHLLHPSATTPERVRGLLAVSLHTGDLARLAGVSESAVRNWRSGQAKPRPHAEIILDDLRAAAQVLLDGAFEPERVGLWLKSRNRAHFENARPIDILASDPMRVLTAAHREVLEDRIALSAGQSPVHAIADGNDGPSTAG